MQLCKMTKTGAKKLCKKSKTRSKEPWSYNVKLYLFKKIVVKKSK